MNEMEKRRFEADNFHLLDANTKFQVANRDFANGIAPVGERAMIIDRAHGNGDGVFNKEDMDIIAAKRADTGFLSGMTRTAEVMLDTAAISMGLSGGFQLGQSGALGAFFNYSAKDDKAPGTSAPENKNGLEQSSLGKSFLNAALGMVGLKDDEPSQDNSFGNFLSRKLGFNGP
ncbi:MAG: hypothetical protein DI551_02065 [Micavibrio aeruginosavorus]|uniref:Uncharacterized protein n=1 Tax=Micavibrio aeruginosavorus TaxID=349221 RepID=A0A2W5Q9K6_9BACT|nr:MAG: hypothetical protein DI551_02065 [Micavibrio aeruginosavorus]